MTIVVHVFTHTIPGCTLELFPLPMYSLFFACFYAERTYAGSLYCLAAYSFGRNVWIILLIIWREWGGWAPQGHKFEVSKQSTFAWISSGTMSGGPHSWKNKQTNICLVLPANCPPPCVSDGCGRRLHLAVNLLAFCTMFDLDNIYCHAIVARFLYSDWQTNYSCCSWLPLQTRYSHVHRSAHP